MANLYIVFTPFQLFVAQLSTKLGDAKVVAV